MDADVARKDRRIRILLADEQSLFREAVMSVLEGVPDCSCRGGARWTQAVAEAERSQPDVVLLDASAPELRWDPATSLIRMTYRCASWSCVGRRTVGPRRRARGGSQWFPYQGISALRLIDAAPPAPR